MNIADISVVNYYLRDPRFRVDPAELPALADSIKSNGLLRPIGVTQDNKLVFGRRRVSACRDILGWDAIDHRVIDLAGIAAGKYDNVGTEFTVSERVAIMRMIVYAKLSGDKKAAALMAGFTSAQMAWVAEVVVDYAPDLAAKVDLGQISVTAAHNQGRNEGRIPVREKSSKPPKPPKSSKSSKSSKLRKWADRIDDRPMITLGKLPSGTAIGEPEGGFASVDERLAWRDRVGAKVVLHPLDIKQLLQDQEIVQQMATALGILARSPDIAAFSASIERMLAHQCRANSSEPGERIDFAKKARDARRSIIDKLDSAIAKLNGYRASVVMTCETVSNQGGSSE